MSQENGTTTFLSPSPDVDVQDPNKWTKISYTREFLLSLDKADSTVKLPAEVQLLISCVVDDASGLLSPPICVPDSECQKSEPQCFLLKVPDDVNQFLHRSDEPYRPPCRYKALPSSNGDSNGLLNGDTYRSSESTNKQKAERERWRKDTVSAAREDDWHSSKNTDFKDSLEEFLMLPARSSKNCSNQHQHMQNITTNGTMNPWLKPVNLNHSDTSWHLVSLLDDGMYYMESEESSNIDVEQPEGTSDFMESLKERRLPSFLSQENCQNHKNHCEVVYEQGLNELQLSNTSDYIYDSPGKMAINDPSDAYISPTNVEDENQFVSMVDNCESATVYGEGISVSMKQNSSSPDFQVHQELDSNSFSSSLEGKSNSSFELCLPDEDSLITFDESFLMPDEENFVVLDSSMTCSPERNSIKADVFNPSSPRDMVEKLVESILNDESSPTNLDDTIVRRGAGLVGGFFHTMLTQQPRTQLCSTQLNPERDQQDQNSFQRNNIDSAIYSYFSHSFPSNTFSQPVPPLYHDELRRLDHEASQSTLKQMINPGTFHLCSLCVPQSGVPLHLPARQMGSCTHNLNSVQSCTFGYQEPNNENFTRPNFDFHGDSNKNQAVVDSFVDMKLRTSHWHPHVGGF